MGWEWLLWLHQEQAWSALLFCRVMLSFPGLPMDPLWNLMNGTGKHIPHPHIPINSHILIKSHFIIKSRGSAPDPVVQGDTQQLPNPAAGCCLSKLFLQLSFPSQILVARLWHQTQLGPDLSTDQKIPVSTTPKSPLSSSLKFKKEFGSSRSQSR